jgi:selenocysteine lyase/cysteine desulfurase
MDHDGHGVLLHTAKRFAYGTRNWGDRVGLAKAVDMWEEIGWDRVCARIESRTDRLKTALLDIPSVVLRTPLPYARSSSIVTFHVPGRDSRQIVDALLENDGVLTSQTDTVGDLPEGVPASVHVFNTDEEIDRLLAGLQRISRAARIAESSGSNGMTRASRKPRAVHGSSKHRGLNANGPSLARVAADDVRVSGA